MRLRVRALLFGSALAVSVGCRPPQAAVTPATGLNPSPRQQMAALAFVDDQVDWEYGNPPSGAKISKGTSEGLTILQTMTPASGPVPDQTLAEFLASQMANHSELQIDVVGHSLGGALAPTLALWLAETRSTRVDRWLEGPGQGQGLLPDQARRGAAPRSPEQRKVDLRGPGGLAA